jgi:hypothetical protein
MKPARIILTANQTAALIEQAGGETIHGRAWAVVAPGSWPDSPGRLVLHLIECPSITAANGACNVAQGILRAVKPRTEKPSQPPPPQSVQGHERKTRKHR